MIKAGLEGRPEDPIIPPYKYKYPNLGVLNNYNGNFSENFWDKWITNPYTNEVNSWINWYALEWHIKATGYQDFRKIAKTRSILLEGASLGCDLQTARMPTWGKNSHTVAKNGRKFADTLQDWCAMGIVAGPIRMGEMPFNEFKVSPMSVAPKPKGKIRPCMDLSFPHDIPADDPNPNSVNAGIQKDLLVSKMSSTLDVCLKIWRNGCETEMAKADWNNAYKHISVRPEDRCLQTFQFSNRLFIETQLTFGSSSSPDRFDCVSDIPLEVSLMNTGIWRDKVAKVLDDTVVIDRKGSDIVGKFYNNFRSLCKNVDISLAGEEDPDKAFGPSSTGIVLGIFYDLPKLTWAIPKEKAERLLIILWDAQISGKISFGTLATLIGKLNHYNQMCRFGKWERSFILNIMDQNKPPYESTPLGIIAQEQVNWWIRSINIARIGSQIPDPRSFTPRIYLRLYPDAAGGNNSNKNAGAGSCFLTSSNQPWTYINWPTIVLKNQPNSRGVRFAHKLSTLEAFAALVGFCSEPDLVRNKVVVIFTDNIGFCYSYENGHSSCLYLHSLTKALSYMASALNSTIYVEKVTRRSDMGSVTADELSKGNIETALGLLPDPMQMPSRVPKTLHHWIQDPFPTRKLGENIADELSQFTEILDWGQF